MKEFLEIFLLIIGITTLLTFLALPICIIVEYRKKHASIEYQRQKALKLGREGETRVIEILGQNEPLRSYYVINDYFFKTPNGYCQIDHIIVNPYGVFVLETKNYSGRIVGNEADHLWKQYLNHGKTVNRIYNPIKQNNTHIENLRDLLPPNTPIAGRVVFVQNNAGIDSPFVINLSELQAWLHKFTQAYMTTEQIENVAQILHENYCDDEKARVRHIKRINMLL